MNRKKSFLTTVSTLGIAVVVKDCSYSINMYVHKYISIVLGYSNTIFYVQYNKD